jgi:hypothetical protein
VYKTQNEIKHPFFIAITYRQYRETGNIVYKTQNEDIVLCLVHNVACVSVLSISDCNEEWMLVFVLCLVHNVACVSVLSISDCNE